MSSQFSPKGGNSPRASPGAREPAGPGGLPVMSGVSKRYDNIVKSPEDKRHYRGLVLSNRLRVLLVSDMTTDKSAAAMDVNVDASYPACRPSSLLKRELTARVPGRQGARRPRGPAVMSGVSKRYDNIVKSPEDKRHYRGLVLSNRLRVLLVSDMTTDKSAAAMDVNVGYLSDPEELPGLAHFCEHMLFLGTEKYPEENEYNKFLSEHGGSSNASTSSDHTTYYFDVLPEHLHKALDIFAQFFISPLFTESATGRELSAVNSEHEKNTSSDTWRLDQLNKSTASPTHPFHKFGTDTWRLDQLNKSTASPTHPFHKFGTGNRETLETIPKSKGIDVRKELLKFHSKWYSANIMTLVIVGKESLDDLEEMVVKLFSEVEDKSVTAPSWPEHPFPPELRRKRAYCYPVKDLRSLSIDFPIPDTRKHYKSGPGHYLSHMLGHEGPGSLLSALKARGWCNSLVGGTRIGARGFGFFGVQVDLTEDGVAHIDDIIKLVFQYMEMLKTEGPQRWVWEEQRDLMALEFRYKDKLEPRSLVTGHVHLLQEFPMEDVLCAYYLMTEWKPELITELLSLLTPENVRVGIVAKGFADKCTMTEPWYGTKYLQEDIEDSKIQEWKSVKPTPELHLPPPNEFIPTRLTLETGDDSTAHSVAPTVIVPTPELHLPPPNEFIPTRLTLETGDDSTAHSVAPTVIVDSPLMRLWFKKDSEFHLPKAVMTFDLVSPLAYMDPLSCNLTSVWVLLLRDSLQQFAYAAELAGLRWSIGNAKYGISVTIDGYDDKQSVLLDKIIDHMIGFTADPKRFHIMKENHIRAIRNFEAEQPYQHAVYQQALCLADVVWTRCQLLEAADRMTPEMVNDFAARMIRKVHIEGFMYGNLSRERALHIAQSVENRLPKDATPLCAQQLLLHRDIEIEKGSWHIRETTNSVHRSSCASLYYDCGVRQCRANVTLELLAHTLAEPCFSMLRTKEQLGYIVFSGLRRSNGVQGFRVIVQSHRHPEYLEERIESFLQGSLEYLENMSDEEFLKHRAALAAQRLEKPKRMSSRAAQIWNEITAQVYNFDRPRVEVEELNTLTKEELIEFYKKHIAMDSPERQKLSVYVISTAEGGAGHNTELKEDQEVEEQPPDDECYPRKARRAIAWGGWQGAPGA
uniref:Insulin-degrading enzyme n=1 Tax=Heliothis virescens TaxID=7102 RepID=A0A2A4K9R5_HELVI